MLWSYILMGFYNTAATTTTTTIKAITIIIEVGAFGFPKDTKWNESIMIECPLKIEIDRLGFGWIEMLPQRLAYSLLCEVDYRLCDNGREKSLNSPLWM